MLYDKESKHKLMKYCCFRFFIINLTHKWTSKIHQSRINLIKICTGLKILQCKKSIQT